MASAARVHLESLLRARKLDQTIAAPDAPLSPGGDPTLASTGLPLLDARLGGGLPRGQLSEIVGPRSSGRTSVALALCAAATARGEVVALVDTCDRLDPESAAAAGVDLGRLLWIRGQDAGSVSHTEAGTPVGRPGWGARHALMARALDQGLKAFSLVLQAGNFGVVIWDLADFTPEAVARLPFATWRRVQRMVEGTDTACALLGAGPLARSAGGVTLELGVGPGLAGGDLWAGASDRARGFRGLSIEGRIMRAPAHWASDERRARMI